MSFLDLSHNLLENLPYEFHAFSVESINLSHNRLLQVPFCLTNFPILEVLKISHNTQITVLPTWICRLTLLKKLGLKGLPNLIEPPKEAVEDLPSCLKYLHTKLARTKPVREMKLIVAGESQTGKSSLIACLVKTPVSDPPPTKGVSIVQWLHHDSSMTEEFEFSVWELGGGESCYPLHELLYSRGCLYILTFNLAQGTQAVEKLRFWLDGIARRGRGSNVVIVGTHLDRLDQHDRLETLRYIQAAVLRLRDDYDSVLSFSSEPFVHMTAEGKLENAHVLRNVIFDSAANYRCRDGHPFMGRRVLLSAVGLKGEVEDYRRLVRKGEKHPLLNRSEMQAMASKLKDLQVLDIKEFSQITAFLNEVGAVIHYNRFGPALEDTYFLDPTWLFARISSALQCHSEQIPVILNKETVVAELDDPSFLISTSAPISEALECFRVVIPIADHWYLVPSRLLPQKPKNVVSPLDSTSACYGRLYTLRNVSPANIGLTLLGEVVAKIPRLLTCLPQPIPKASSAAITGSLTLWKDGICFRDGDLCLLVEAFNGNNKKRISVTVSCADGGTELFCHVVDLMPQVCADAVVTIPCPKCLEMGQSEMYEFSREKCIQALAGGNRQMATHPVGDPHQVELETLVPELLLLDIPADYVLSHVVLEKELKPTPLHVLYQGKYLQRSVVVAHFEYLSGEAFKQIRAEAGLISNGEFHPCISSPLGLCIQTTSALIAYELPPLGDLFWILRKAAEIPRLVVYRMVVQIIAGLRFLHHQGVAPLSMPPSFIQIWSMSEQALAHCKLSRSTINNTLLSLTPKLVSDNMQQLGCLIFELICRSKPPVESDENQLHLQCYNEIVSKGYFYLAHVVLSCWRKTQNFLTDDLVKDLSTVPAQSLLNVCPVQASIPIADACSVAGSDIGCGSEVWFCCCNKESGSLELRIAETSSMICTFFDDKSLKGTEIQCMKHCKENVWFASRMNGNIGVISIFGVASRDQVHSIKMKNNYITCIASTDTTVYLGTHAGFLFMFSTNVQAVKSGLKPKHKYISDSSIAGIVVVKQHIWISHSKHIYLVDPETLEFKSICQRSGGSADMAIGHLQIALNELVIFSVCMDRSMVSAWDVSHQKHLYDIRIEEHLQRVLGPELCTELANNSVITSFTAGIDTVWVGTCSGHILVFSDGILVTWMQPYRQEVALLCPIFEANSDSLAIVSGGKGYCLLQPEECDGQRLNSSMLALWATFPKKVLQQMKAVEQTQGGYLLSHEAMARTIKENSFIDATLACQHPSVKTPDQ